jgi:multiple sugar transport system permease protein
MKNRKQKELAVNIVLFYVICAISIFFAIPFIYMILMSFMPTSNSVVKYPPDFSVLKLSFDNYINAFETINMGQLLGNTIFMVISTMVIGITSSILIAYGFSRFKNKYTNVFFVILLSTMMIPWVVTMIPAYTEFEFLGWIGTRAPLIIPWIGGSAFNVFMLKQFMDDIPYDLDEAAKIDGAGSLTILFKVLLPQIKPCLATLMVYAFINAWSDYVGPSIYLQGSPELFTLSLGMRQFFSSTGSANWTHVLAASVMFSIPMILVLTLAQKAFVRGVVSSGIK